MSKQRPHSGVCASTPRSRRDPHRNLVPPNEICIFPGNRFFLLPLKKVSTFVDHRCQGSSATSTKACILQEPTISSRTTIFHIGQPTNRCVTRDIIQGVKDHNNSRFTARHSSRNARRSLKKQRDAQHTAIVRTRLSPVSEHELFEHEENLSGSGFLLDRVRNQRPSARPVTSGEKLAGLVITDGQCTNSTSQLELRRVEHEQSVDSLGRVVETRRRRVRGVTRDGIWSRGGVYQGGLSRWVEDRDILTGATLDYDFCGTSSNVGKPRPKPEIPLDSWGDESLQSEPGLPESCAGGLEMNFDSRSTTNNEMCLGILPEKLKQRLREGLEGVSNKISPSRIRKSPSSSLLETYLTRFDQSISEKTSCDYLLKHLKEEEPKIGSKPERDFSDAVHGNVEYRGGATCRQDDLSRGEQPLEVLSNRRRNRKKKRGVQIIGKNRIWPCSRPTGYGTARSTMTGHQVLPTPLTSTNSAEIGIKLEQCKARRSGRDGRRHGNHGPHQGSAASNIYPAQGRFSWEGFLCPCSSLKDLPIGPARVVELKPCRNENDPELRKSFNRNKVGNAPGNW